MTEEKRTSGTDQTIPPRSKDPTITYGNWSSTSDLQWREERVESIHKTVLYQKFRRRVKRDWGGGCYSRSYEYEWKPVPHAAP